MKKIRRIVLALILLAVVVAVIGVFGIDVLAKAGVEKGATYALGVETTVGRMDLSLLGGGLRMEELRIANPEGFASPAFVESGKFSLDMDPGSIFTDTVVVNDFELNGLTLRIEQKLTGSNVGKILGNLKRFESADKSKTESPGKKIKADRIVVKSVTAEFYLSGGGFANGPITVVIPEIEITDLQSDDPSGLTTARLVSKIVQEVLAKVFAQSDGAVPGDVLRGLDSQLSTLKGAVGERLRGLSDKFPLRLPSGTE